MRTAKQTFQKSYNRVIEIHSLYKHLSKQNFPEVFISDLLRSEVVYIVSAFDRFIHDILKKGILESFNEERTQTNSYKKFNINLEQFEQINNPSSSETSLSVLEQIIIASHKHISFQDPTKVSQGLSLIWTEKHKWQVISNKLGMDEKVLKRKLNNIIIRRNQIVHEADIDLYTNEPQELSANDTKEMIDFIKDLTETIYAEIKCT